MSRGWAASSSSHRETYDVTVASCGRAGTVDLRVEAGHDSHASTIPQLGQVAAVEPLQQQGAPVRVCPQQPDDSVAVPVLQREASCTDSSSPSKLSSAPPGRPRRSAPAPPESRSRARGRRRRGSAPTRRARRRTAAAAGRATHPSRGRDRAAARARCGSTIVAPAIVAAGGESSGRGAPGGGAAPGQCWHRSSNCSNGCRLRPKASSDSSGAPHSAWGLCRWAAWTRPAGDRRCSRAARRGQAAGLHAVGEVRVRRVHQGGRSCAGTGCATAAGG